MATKSTPPGCCPSPFVAHKDIVMDLGNGLRRHVLMFWKTVEAFMSGNEFYSSAAAAKFVFSPRDNGHNCYRAWEALVLGNILILKHHPSQGQAYTKRTGTRFALEQRNVEFSPLLNGFYGMERRTKAWTVASQSCAPFQPTPSRRRSKPRYGLYRFSCNGQPYSLTKTEWFSGTSWT